MINIKSIENTKDFTIHHVIYFDEIFNNELKSFFSFSDRLQ